MTEFFRRFRGRSAPRTPILPPQSAEAPGTRLATLRAVAAHTGWGAGIGPIAALVGAVCWEEDRRIATIAAPLVAVAVALAGYPVVAYGDEPPLRPVPTEPLAWGIGEVPPLRRRFDAVAVDATAVPLEPVWLNDVLSRIAFQKGRVYLAILCAPADAAAYKNGCRIASWDMHGTHTTHDAPPAVLLTSARP